jgi:hypothetical protein
MDFVKYQHVERLGTDEVDGITSGICHVFAKIDGTNGSAWLNNGKVCFGSRNHELGGDGDNQGFKTALENDTRIAAYLAKHPTHRLYGEWLVPHSLKTYRTDAWKRFYVFDVCIDTEDGGVEYIPYTIYAPLLDEFGIDYIPLLAEVRNGSVDQFYNLLDQNTFLIQDGSGSGEGIVIKNYAFKNKYGRVTWAKIVRSEFKELNHKIMGAPIILGEKVVEEAIAKTFCTDALIEKEYAKIVTEEGGWNSRMIPRLLGIVFHSIVSENAWEIVKQHKLPKIDFKLLNRMVIERIKEAKREIFA